MTGSKYLLETGGRRILVDCGLFQGLKDLRERNWAPLPVDPKLLDAVVLTHAHIDHTGYLPRLVKPGLQGPRVLHARHGGPVPDHAARRRAGWPKKTRATRTATATRNTRPALPLFTEDDALQALTHLQPVGYDRPVPVSGAGTLSFVDAGHLLGSAFARFTLEADGGQRDPLRRRSRPLQPSRAARSVARGDRRRPARRIDLRRPRARSRTTTARAWRRSSRTTIAGGGKVIIPAFAVGRVEEVIYWLKTLEDARRIPIGAGVPRQPDGGRRAEALREPQPRSRPGHADAAAARCRAFTTRRFTAVASPQQSKEIQASTAPCIVISASGMATGGRVLNHLKAALPGPAQHGALRRLPGRRHARPPAARGRRDREDPRPARARGRAHRTHRLDVGPRRRRTRSCGGCAASRRPPRMTYLVHGEPPAQAALQGAHRAGARLAGPRARVPGDGRVVSAPDDRPYLLERVDDAAVVQLYADGFDELAPREKTLVYHLSRAALAGPRHLLRPALRAEPRHARGRRGDRHAPGERRRRHAGAGPPLREALLAEQRAAQQPDGAQVRAALRARRRSTAAVRAAARRRRAPAAAGPARRSTACSRRLAPCFFDPGRRRQSSPARRRARAATSSR